MTKPKPSHIKAMTEVFETSLKAKSVGSFTEHSLTSILFPGGTRISKDMGELREELFEKNHLMFYSNIIKNDEEFLSINITRL